MSVTACLSCPSCGAELRVTAYRVKQPPSPETVRAREVRYRQRVAELRRRAARASCPPLPPAAGPDTTFGRRLVWREAEGRSVRAELLRWRGRLYTLPELLQAAGVARSTYDSRRVRGMPSLLAATNPPDPSAARNRKPAKARDGGRRGDGAPPAAPSCPGGA